MHYVPLYKAALNGDWECARRFFERDPQALTAVISTISMTAGHVAASAGQSGFVEKLVELMPMEALEMKDAEGRTILHYAAISGSIKAARALVKKNRALTQIMDIGERTPLSMISWNNMSKEMVWYLCCVTTDDPPASQFTGPIAAAELITGITNAGLFGKS